MRFLVVEDNRSLAQSIARTLQQVDHAVDMLHNAADAMDVLGRESYDLVILDLSLPGGDGLDVLRSLRRNQNDVPVLILTARGELNERLAGLNAGADDYMVKPFELSELEARARVLLRRSSGSRSPLIEAGPLAFDTVQRTVTLNGNDVALTPRERSLLEVLIRNYGKIIAKERLAEHLFGFDESASIGSIELYVSRLRKKISTPGISIRTVRGLGYMLSE
ncbi:response regulator transcription factor [Telmatospirillum sp. J64-1]|uniref:response regulator transcription factor n=1 Tax=Telmatospirillum sp. J64-1 TaxID=2502183 RepID=UPI00115D96CD|nr:response regulator transcription factor [Telmatospirillum sp. J64-1]